MHYIGRREFVPTLVSLSDDIAFKYILQLSEVLTFKTILNAHSSCAVQVDELFQSSTRGD